MAGFSLAVYACRYGSDTGTVKFKTEWESVSADEVEIVFTGKMEKDGTYILRICLKEDYFSYVQYG